MRHEIPVIGTRRRSRFRRVLLVGMLLALDATRASAGQVDFDAVAPGTNGPALGAPGVTIDAGTIVDTGFLGLLAPGYAGPSSTSGAQSLLNTGSGFIGIDFATPVDAVALDVLSIPGAMPFDVPVLLQAYQGTTPTVRVVSSGGASAERLRIVLAAPEITRIVLFPRVPCTFVACTGGGNLSDVVLDAPNSFWVDSLAFGADVVVPEPGTATLLGVGLFGMAWRRRPRPRAAPRARRRLGVSCALGFGLAGLATFVACFPVEVVILTPQSHSLQLLDPATASPELTVELDLGAPLQAGGTLQVAFLTRLDAPVAEVEDVSTEFVVDAATGRFASAALPIARVPEGRHQLQVSVDRNGDGQPDATTNAVFTVAYDTGRSIARIWNEVLLEAIRKDTPRPTVHARNLFHLSVALWDCWVAYDDATGALPYLYGASHTAPDVALARRACMSQAAFRLLEHRFQASIGAAETLPAIDAQMIALGYSTSFVPSGPGDDSPEAVGDHVAEAVIAYGATDGANEAGDYADPTYFPVNQPLLFKLPGTGGAIWNPNRWTPLAFDFRCFQNGIPFPNASSVQVFVGSHWNDVAPFSLTRSDPAFPYFDPGPPPQAVEFDAALGGVVGPGDPEFKAQMFDVVRKSSRLDPDTAPWINISPGVHGGNSLSGFEQGVLDGTGYGTNPVTGLPYASNWVNEADWGRVIAEFWADGPDSETPPGHWNVLANTVSGDPHVVKRIGGVGPVVDDLEWDVKLYLALNGAVHDSAVAAWGAKRIYDYARPLAGIRWMAEQGQSSDPSAPSYSVHGVPLEPGLSEVITVASSAPGERHEHLAAYIGEIAFNVWPGEPNRAEEPTCADPSPIPDPNATYPPYSGREWILAKSWITYQRRTFVTPPFAAYVSGHSTFSRAAAVVLERITGSPYFPGGLGEYVAPQNAFLVFETGPTQTVRLQWARYTDAADEAGISRLWGGIHVAADDFSGRLMGAEIGESAYALAAQYWDGTL